MKRVETLTMELLTEPIALTEDALASEFTRRHHDDLLYVHEWGRWLRWDGQRWAHERTLAVYDLARKLVREMDAGPKLAARIESAATVNAIVSLARADRAHARVTEQFDCDPWILNTPAGTVDLHTGAIRPHARRDGLTKITPRGTEPGRGAALALLPREVARGDAELIGFLQRLCGYWCTGSVREEVFVILSGPGGNGKSKFIETVRGCLGHDYATGLAMETLLATPGSSTRPTLPTSAPSAWRLQRRSRRGAGSRRRRSRC